MSLQSAQRTIAKSPHARHTSDPIGAPVSATPTALLELIEDLTPEAIIEGALAIEASRSQESDALLLADADLLSPGLITTTFMAQSAHLARSEGRFAFNQRERGHLAPPEAWVPPGFGPQPPPGETGTGRLSASRAWAFRQDAPLAHFALGDSPKWWTHGLVHALLGGAYWEEISEWELMHVARLGEAIASWHWYWLSELERRYCERHSVTSGDGTPDCDTCRALEREAGLSAARVERLKSPEALEIAQNGLQFLRFEAYSFQRGLERGELVVPEGPYLTMGEACDYARAHRQRLVSPSHRRWLEACLRAGEEYATSPGDFATRTATLARRLITPTAPLPSVERERALRVLQDLGARVCQAAALIGDPLGGFSQAMGAIAEGITSLRSPRDREESEGILTESLQAVAQDLSSSEELAQRVLALGYRPLREYSDEPSDFRRARRRALITQSRLDSPPLAALLQARPDLCDALLARARTPSLLHDLLGASEEIATKGADGAMVAAFMSWLALIDEHWDSAPSAGSGEQRWYYRLALSRWPDKATWSELRVRPNPYLTAVPCPFTPSWLESLLCESEDTPDACGPPQMSTAPAYALVGPGRRGPLLLPWTDARRSLLNRLEHTPTVAELLSLGVSLEALRLALDEELILVLQSRDATTLQVAPVAPLASPSRARSKGEVPEDPGPWEDDDQASYYEAFCERNPLYRRLADALLDKSAIAPSHRVVDLGCGHGVSTRALLERLGPEAEVIAFDPSPRMLQSAVSRIDDRRVSFEAGSARRMLQVAGPCDRVISNSAIWLDADVLIPWKASEMILKPGGRLSFSIPAEYLGHDAHWRSESAQHLAETLQRVRAELMSPGREPLDRPSMPHPGYLGSVARVRELLKDLGFSKVDAELFTHPWTLGDYLDWLGQPTSLEHLCGADTDTQRAFINEVSRRVSPSEELETHWYLVVAHK